MKIESGSHVSIEQIHDPSTSYMKDKHLMEILIEELSRIAEAHFSDSMNDLLATVVNYPSEVQRFMTLYSHRPLRDNTGGSGFHNAFWLFLTARLMNPRLIIESGVWKGHTTWLFEQVCPDSNILGFDIDLSKLEYKDGKAEFFERDWSEFDFRGIDPERSMIFFDCHVNHAQRIIESHERGFQHIIFDDNPPIHKLYGYGLPGFPTANMLYTGLGLDLSEISWCWKGQDRTYQIK